MWNWRSACRVTEMGGVPAELLKSGTEKLYELLRQIFECCLNGEEIPSD